jgi:hypothetical protein
MESKPLVQSNAAWASTVTVIVGLLAGFNLIPPVVADYIQANTEQVVGGVVAVLGLFNLWATSRRKTAIKGLF